MAAFGYEGKDRYADLKGARAVVCDGQWGAGDICVGCGRVQRNFGPGIGGGGGARACGPCAKGDRKLETWEQFNVS